jgi:hypothetical protein
MHVRDAFAMSTTPGGGALAPRRAAPPAQAAGDRRVREPIGLVEHLLLLCAVHASTTSIAAPTTTRT